MQDSRMQENKTKKIAVMAMAATIAIVTGIACGSRDAVRADSHESLRNTAYLPVRLLGSATALAVGVPSHVAKRQIENACHYAESVSDEMNARDGNVALILASGPGQIIKTAKVGVEATVEGLWKIEDGWREPFSARSFALQD